MDGGVWSHTETLEVIQNRDIAKNEYCIKPNIPLVRIPYYYLEKITIEDLLGDKFLINKGVV